ncbi:MAG: hypothetical protein WBM34_05610 [Woeseiaceae bacterium]
MNSRLNITALSGQDDAISKRLVAARLGAEALPDFPGSLPETMEQAYSIQSASLAQWPDDVGGWKVGLLSEADSQRFSAERLAGPIFRTSILHTESGSCETMPIYVGGFAAVEAEFILELGTEVRPFGARYSNKQLIDIVSAMYVGAEIASSPMAAVNKLGPTCVVSDFGNNAGLILGPSIPNWSSRSLDSLTSSVTVDDVVVGKASADAIPGGPLQAMRFLLELCSTRGITLPVGTLISTGATTGIHEVTVASKSRVDFGELGFLNVEFKAVSPNQNDRRMAES